MDLSVYKESDTREVRINYNELVKIENPFIETFINLRLRAKGFNLSKTITREDDSYKQQVVFRQTKLKNVSK